MLRLKSWVLNQWQVMFPPAGIPIEERPLLDQVEFLLKGLDVDWFKTYRVFHGHGVQVETFYPTLDKYIEAIDLHGTILRSSGEAQESMCQRKLTSVPINQFFLSHDNYYQDVQQVLSAFQETSLRLCVQLRDTKSVTSGAAAYNMRLLTPLVTNIKNICLVLIDIHRQAL